MKRKMMYLLCAVVLIFVATAAWYLNKHFHSAAYFLSKLPEKYKHYPALNENVTSARHVIKPLITGNGTYKLYVDKQNHKLVISKIETGDRQISKPLLSIAYYRLDSSGAILDSLVENDDSDDWGNEFNGHLLYKDHYTNYLVSGGPEQRPYKESNRDLTMEETQLKILTDSLQAAADATRTDWIYGGGSSRPVFFFSVKGAVHKVYAASGNISIASRSGKTFWPLGAVTASSQETGRPYNWTGENVPLRIDYFLKEQYNRKRKPAFMAPAPITRPASWDGVGYFSLRYPDDTLVFKHPIYLYPNEDSSPPVPYYDNQKWGKLDYFIPPDFDFQLLTVGYDTDYQHRLNGCYLVLPRGH